jgi:hypothetical protein
MSRLLFAWALVLGVLVLPAHGQEGDEPKKVTVGGRELEVYSPEELRARGFEVPDIPEDQNAAWVYLEAFDRIANWPSVSGEAIEAAVDGEWPEGEDGDLLAAWVEENGASLDLLRQASRMDQCYMPFFRDDSDVLFMGRFPTLSPARGAARALSIEAAWHLSKGNVEAALECHLATQRLANHIGNGETLIEGLVGIAISKRAGAGLRQIAESGLADAELLEASVAEMNELAGSFPSFEQMVRAEQRWAGAFVDDAIEIPGAVWMVVGGGDGETATPPMTGWHRLSVRLRRLYLPDRAIKKHLREHYDAIIEAAQIDAAGGKAPLEEDRLYERIPAWDVLSRMALPSLARLHEVVLESRSSFERTRLTMAVEAYKAGHGEYPAQLTSLVPEYVASIPVDPMTSYEFEYEATSGAGADVSGLKQITREDRIELHKKRRTPAILNPRAAKWRRYVLSVCERYEFTDAQRVSAQAILRDVDARAGRYEQTHGESIQALIEAGESEELARRMGPLDKMFQELKQRLEALATAKQRAAAKKKS